LSVLRIVRGGEPVVEEAIERGVVGLGDEYGEVPARTTFVGEFIGASAENGPFGKASRELCGVGLVWLVTGLEDFIASHGGSSGGKMGVARS